MPNSANATSTIHISFKLVAIVIGVLLAATLGIRFGLMKSVAVGPGEEIVFIDSPYFWGKTGVRDTPLTRGRKTEFNTTDIIRVSVVPTISVVRVLNIPTRNNNTVNVVAFVALRVTNSPDLIDRFGVQWYENTIAVRLPSVIRNEIGRRNSTDLVADTDIIKQTEVSLGDEIRQLFVDDNIPVELVDLSIAEITPGVTIKPSAIR